MYIEWVCLCEFRHFCGRHIRYFWIFIALYTRSLYSWKTARRLRVGYCLTQHIDDVLDGDRKISENPEEYTRDLLDQIKKNEYKQHPISRLAQFITEQMHNVPDQQSVTKLVALIEVLLVDYQRRKNRQIFTRKQLEQQHYNTFLCSLELTLDLANATVVPEQLEHLIGALSWCSPMRDLEEDLQKGLINVPLEVVNGFSIQKPDEVIYQKLWQLESFQQWIAEEYNKGQYHIQQCLIIVPTVANKKTRLILYLLAKALEKYARSYYKRHQKIINQYGT